jgi:hypothetical protein
VSQGATTNEHAEHLPGVSGVQVKTKFIRVTRSELRANQSTILREAAGPVVVAVGSRSKGEDVKYIVDKQYFEQLLSDLKSAAETLEIMADPRLFSNLLSQADTIDDDLRLGKLKSAEEVFSEGDV